MWRSTSRAVSVLFNEPKLLKTDGTACRRRYSLRFSALQRAEIAENILSSSDPLATLGFSALQRAEIAENGCDPAFEVLFTGFQCSSTSRNC